MLTERLKEMRASQTAMIEDITKVQGKIARLQEGYALREPGIHTASEDYAGNITGIASLTYMTGSLTLFTYAKYVSGFLQHSASGTTIVDGGFLSIHAVANSWHPFTPFFSDHPVERCDFSRSISGTVSSWHSGTLPGPYGLGVAIGSDTDADSDSCPSQTFEAWRCEHAQWDPFIHTCYRNT